LEQRPERVIPLLGRSEAHLVLGDTRRTLDVATRALSARAEAYLKMGHLQAAEHDFEQALQKAATKHGRARLRRAR
jgi:hypothetical protein